MLYVKNNHSDSDYQEKVSSIFNISDKQFVSFYLDLNSVEKEYQSFVDNGDTLPQWMNFWINLVAKIILNNQDVANNIVIKENFSYKNLLNKKQTELDLTIDDFIDIVSQRYLESELGCFIVWNKISENSSKGLISPILDGYGLVCFAEKNDPIYKYLKEISEKGFI